MSRIIRLRRGCELQHTIREIVLLARAPDARVVRCARDLAARAGRDTRELARALYTFGRRQWAYVDDPQEFDTVDDVGDIIDGYWRCGRLAGDCDDAAAVMAALALGMGRCARLVTCAWYPDPAHAHIWAEVDFNYRGMTVWHALDVSTPRQHWRPEMIDAAVWPV